MTAVEVCARCLAGAGWHYVRTPHGELNGWWVKGDRVGELAALMEQHGPAGDVTVSAVPLLEVGSFRLRQDSPVLWVRTETRDSCKRLARFRPEPTLVMREGDTCRQVALWSLTAPCPIDKLERANGRLSYSLRCKLKHGAQGFEFAVPGTVLREGRKRPVPVVAAGGSGEPVGAGALLARLRDRPAPPEWLGRAA